MAKTVGMDDDVYMLDASVPSLSPHSDVVYTRNFIKKQNPDGSFLLAFEADPGMLMAYTARALPLTGMVLEDVVGHVFPDGKLQYDAERLLEEKINPLVTKLRTAVDLN